MTKKKKDVAEANNSNFNHTNDSRNESMTILNFNGNTIAFEEINGMMMVNATQMAKPFGKRPADWLKTQQAKDLLKVVSKGRKIVPTDLQIVRNGGLNYGTWLQKDVALFFAQWLSAEFYWACNIKLEELLTKQITHIPSKYGVLPILIEGEKLYPYAQSVRTIGNVKTGSTNRKKKHPKHFRMVFNRNFVTESYLDYLNAFYKQKETQLKLAL